MSKKSAKNKNSKALALPTIENSDSVTTIAAIETVEENMVDVPEEQPVLIVDAPESAENIIDDLVVAIESSVSIIENPESMVEEVVVTNEEVVEPAEMIADNIENLEPVVESNVPAIEEVIPVPEVKTKKAGKKHAVSDVKTDSERVKLVGTSYHYFRNWLKNTLRSGEIHTAKFIKNDADWNGYISIPSNDKEAALKIFDKYRVENPETKDLWWDVVSISK